MAVIKDIYGRYSDDHVLYDNLKTIDKFPREKPFGKLYFNDKVIFKVKGKDVGGFVIGMVVRDGKPIVYIEEGSGRFVGKHYDRPLDQIRISK
uniref:Uncharacterized protein n=1 Tax=Marseillevirus LCMAC101 TaxID=2506602 RepID=A0A481YS01_9VIRU|nr:MAG: hypothetical protein LCMAC101_05770 [Marseillevirus LCMAC101]